MSDAIAPDAGPRLRMSVYDLAVGAGGAAVSGSGCWFVHAAAGELTLAAGPQERTIAGHDGAFARQAFRLEGAASAWIFEIAPLHSPYLAGADIVRSAPLRPSFAGPYLLRADRIQSSAGAVTPRHGHRGPGLRRLIYGRLLAELGDAVERIDAGDAWFETGQEMVVGTNVGGADAAFVRVMLLPYELAGGKSSFVAQDEIEAAKPRRVQSRLFEETVLSEDDVEAWT